MIYINYAIDYLVWCTLPGNDQPVPGFQRDYQLENDFLITTEMFREEIENFGWVTGEGAIERDFEFISVTGLDFDKLKDYFSY